MRQGSNPKRLRGRTGRKNPHSRSQTFESNGPEVKVRGNAQQVVEKYLALARDASSAGDRITAESYFQHAEHYYRVMTANGGPDDRNGQNGQHNRPMDGDYRGDNDVGDDTGHYEQAEQPSVAAPIGVVANGAAPQSEQEERTESVRPPRRRANGANGANGVHSGPTNGATGVDERSAAAPGAQEDPAQEPQA